MSNTIPMLQEVEESLEMVREHTGMPAVIRVAAHAGLLLAQKYHSMNDECEVYRIAIGNNYSYLCALIQYPYNFCSHVSRQEVAMVCRPQLESGSHRRGKAAGNRSVDNVLQTNSKCCRSPCHCCECFGHREFASIFAGYLLTISIKPGSRWKLLPKLRSTHPLDSIEGYLAAPTIDEDEIKTMGGVMMYWYQKEESCPSLSRYGADYCSAPGKLLLLLI